MKNSAQEMNTPMSMTGTAPMILVPLSTMSIMNTSMILTMNSMLPTIIVTLKPLMGISTSMTMLHMKSMRMICMFTAMIAESTEDRAFTHVHDHGHNFYHGHFHSHHPEHTTAMHKVFGDPARDWFAAGLMGVLIAAGYFKLLPGYLSDGMLVCAAIIGIFPLMKNAVFECIGKRTVNADILAGAVLLAGLFMGRFTAVALVALFLLIGSFLRLNFSWRND